MPHIHRLVWIDSNGKAKTPEWVNEYITARIPALPPIHDQSDEANQQRRLWNYVCPYMLHDCNRSCEGTRLVGGVEQTYCKKSFPKAFADQTEISGIDFFKN